VSGTRAQTGWQYYGWWGIVLATFIIIWTTNGLTVGAITAFDTSLLALLKVNRGDLKFGDTVMLLTTAVITPLTGWIADRWGVRPVMAVGVIALAAAFFGLSSVETLNGMYALRFLMGISLSCAGLAICVVIVSRWFEARRGLAIGLTLAGTSLANAFFPDLTTLFIEREGWRGAAYYVSIMPLLLLPLILFALKEWPSKLGLEPYGSAAQPAGMRAPAAPELSYADILAKPAFWFIGIAAFATFYSILAISYNLFLHTKDLGIDPREAAKYFVPLFIGGLVGKLLSGFLSDLFGRKLTWLIFLGLMLTGALFLLTNSEQWLYASVACFGLGWGGNYTLLQAVTADAFGTRSLGRVMGAITVLDASGGAIGPWITGMLYDRYGSYISAFWAIAVLIALAIVMALLVPTRSPTQAAGAEFKA